MKVLHVYRTYFPDTQGGLEETIRQICVSTRACGVESEVLTISPSALPARLDAAEATVYRARQNIDIASCNMGMGAFRLFRERARAADIVHYHFPWPFADVLALALPPDRPQVMTYHSDIVRQRLLKFFYQPLMHRFLRRMDAIVATSDAYASGSPVLRSYRDKLQVIPIGIDERGYPAPAAPLMEQIRQRFGSDFFLFLGVLRQYKGVGYLLEAARGTNLSVVIAGTGPMEEELRQRAAEQGLSNVHFLGYVSDEMKVGLLQACRALVLPSCFRSEAFGVSLLEGAMLGKPLLTTELGTGTSLINVHEKTGLVVPPADADALRAAMRRLQTHADEAQAFGQAARDRYSELFRAELMGRRYHYLYQSVEAGRVLKAAN